jgi:hypothetical protein
MCPTIIILILGGERILKREQEEIKVVDEACFLTPTTIFFSSS